MQNRPRESIPHRQADENKNGTKIADTHQKPSIKGTYFRPFVKPTSNKKPTEPLNQDNDVYTANTKSQQQTQGENTCSGLPVAPTESKARQENFAIDTDPYVSYLAQHGFSN